MALAVDGESDGVSNGGDVRQPTSGGDEGVKSARLPRWTREEILILIQGKRVAESRVRRGRAAGSEFGSGQLEPKWASIASYCMSRGVNRGPVQCRKRWSNLAGDFKKIKEYESNVKEETESFWVMRNDLRREKKLPGFFDKEVYDILAGGTDGGGGGDGMENLTLALAPSSVAMEEEVEVEVKLEPEALFDSGRTAAADDGLFSDFEEVDGGGGVLDKDFPADKEAPPASIPAPTPISEKQYRPLAQGRPVQGTSHEKEPAMNPDQGSTRGGNKRKRYATEGDEETTNLQRQLIETLERNGKLLSYQLEAQNTNSQLEREQQKDHSNSLIAVFNKLADALGKIADKL